jgi:hypothetical protein
VQPVCGFTESQEDQQPAEN